MKKHILIFTLLFSVLYSSYAQSTSYEPTAENLKAREEFQDSKFGIFIHWGLYAMLASGEWTMTVNDLDHHEYAKLAGGFYPSKFSAKEWVTTIKDSGAKYITITTRHHDGFSMFDSKFTDYTITKATPFKRDILKELAEECEKQGIKLHLYYSHIDWTRDDAPRGETGKGTKRPSKEGNWDSYSKFMNNQLTELLTNYGSIGAIWFDGLWDLPDSFNWDLPTQYNLIHKLQPATLVANNHHRNPFPGEDIQVFEKDLPGENKGGHSGNKSVSQLPLETCETMNGMWGYKIIDQNYKSTKDLIHYLVKAAGKNANLLMNVGPQPDGQFPAVSIQRLKEMGEWLKENGESIYGTRGGLIPACDWGVTTQKGNKLYVHILNLTDKGLFLPVSAAEIKSVKKFNTNNKLQYLKNNTGITVLLPEVPTDIDYILEIELKK